LLQSPESLIPPRCNAMLKKASKITQSPMSEMRFEAGRYGLAVLRLLSGMETILTCSTALQITDVNPNRCGELRPNYEL